MGIILVFCRVKFKWSLLIDEWKPMSKSDIQFSFILTLVSERRAWAESSCMIVSPGILVWVCHLSLVTCDDNWEILRESWLRLRGRIWGPGGGGGRHDVINRGAGRGNQSTLFSDVAVSGARSGEERRDQWREEQSVMEPRVSRS